MPDGKTTWPQEERRSVGWIDTRERNENAEALGYLMQDNNSSDEPLVPERLWDGLCKSGLYIFNGYHIVVVLGYHECGAMYARRS